MSSSISALSQMSDNFSLSLIQNGPNITLRLASIQQSDSVNVHSRGSAAGVPGATNSEDGTKEEEDGMCHYEGEEEAESTGFPPSQSNLIFMPLSRLQVSGIDLDEQTCCAHYRTEFDILAIRMKCCGVYYACKDCHDALAGHPAEVWPRSEWNARAILCGPRGHGLTIREYMGSGYLCPHCRARFNPSCRNHYHFEPEGTV